METSTLSSVPPPDITYTLALPASDSGALSALQLEAITYACQVTPGLPCGPRPVWEAHQARGGPACQALTASLARSNTRSCSPVGSGPASSSAMARASARGARWPASSWRTTCGAGKSLCGECALHPPPRRAGEWAPWHPPACTPRFSVSNDLKYDAERDLRDIEARGIAVHALSKVGGVAPPAGGTLSSVRPHPHARPSLPDQVRRQHYLRGRPLCHLLCPDWGEPGRRAAPHAHPPDLGVVRGGLRRRRILAGGGSKGARGQAG